MRVASIDTPVPYSPPLEDYYLPQTKDVVDAARKLAAILSLTESNKTEKR